MRLSLVQLWLVVAALLVAVHSALSSWLQPGLGLTVFGNVTQCVILTVLVLALGRNAWTTRGSTQAFWVLMLAGGVLWLATQGLWTYYEVYLRHEVPNPFVGDVVIFLHIVPMMGALALRPHRHGERPLRLGLLDFSLLLLWWVFLYLFVVIPWQYVHFDEGPYGFNFNVLYDAEKVAFLLGIGIFWLRSTGTWKRVYCHLFVAAVVYEVASHAINVAIDQDRYYTGSFFDVLLVISMVWFVGAALIAHERPATSEPSVEPPQEVWPSRLAMAAVLSIPAFLLWNRFFSDSVSDVRSFRLLVGLGAMVLLTFLVFLKQHILDRELLRLLRASEESLEHQRALQDELIRSEKLASMGRLVAGAAHEINNPLTAILGYADLLESDPAIPDAQRSLAGKVRQQARRTHELVNNLVRFAKRAPGEKSRVSVGTVLSNAIRMRSSELAEKMIFLEAQTKLSLPEVWADEQQLLTIFIQLINNAADAMSAEGGGMLTVRSREENDHVVLEFSDTGPGVKDTQRVFDPFYTTKPVGKGTGLGLSVVYGIVKEHGGNIACFNRPEGGATFVLTLPIATPNGSKASDSPASSTPLAPVR
jgi:signal transduction histidine kinase